MSPVTHLLVSWTTADACRLRGRDRTLATWCGVLPDADGLGVLVDAARRVLGRPDTWLYGEFHHALFHGLFAAIAFPLLMSAFAVRRLRVFAVGVVVVHLHLLCDVVGSRGPGIDDLWPLPYLAPFSDRWTVRWPGQWALNAWPNVVLTLALMAFAFWRAARDGYSPVAVFSRRADRAFVEAVRNRWRSRGRRRS